MIYKDAVDVRGCRIIRDLDINQMVSVCVGAYQGVNQWTRTWLDQGLWPDEDIPSIEHLQLSKHQSLSPKKNHQSQPCQNAWLSGSLHGLLMFVL